MKRTPRERMEEELRRYAESVGGDRWRAASVMVAFGPGEPVKAVAITARRAGRSPDPSPALRVDTR